jgi:hypothetical protein
MDAGAATDDAPPPSRALLRAPRAHAGLTRQLRRSTTREPANI